MGKRNNKLHQIGNMGIARAKGLWQYNLEHFANLVYQILGMFLRYTTCDSMYTLKQRTLNLRSSVNAGTCLTSTNRINKADWFSL